jgi:hypothetical protein
MPLFNPQSGAFTTAITVNEPGSTTMALTRTDDGSAGPVLTFTHATTTPAISDIVGQISFNMTDASLGKPVGAAIRGVSRDITAGAASGDLYLLSRVSGSLGTRVIVATGMYMSGATGGDKGANTFNASAVYDDNVLLTDLVLDYAVDGTFDLGKYAGHPVSTEVSDWWFDPDQYAIYWKRERKLPGMVSWDKEDDRPSTGSLITRLTAVVETQAVLIEKLNQEIKKLKKDL